MRHRVARWPLRVRLPVPVAGALLVGLGIAASAPVHAQVTDDEAEIGRRLQKVLREHGGEIYGCYGKRLAEQPKLAGELLLRIYVGSSPTGAGTRSTTDSKSSRIPIPALALTRRMASGSTPSRSAG